MLRDPMQRFFSLGPDVTSFMFATLQELATFRPSEQFEADSNVNLLGCDPEHVSQLALRYP
jgi:hypothetical protein